MSKSIDVMEELAEATPTPTEAHAVRGAFNVGRAAAMLQLAKDGESVNASVPFVTNLLFNTPIPQIKELAKVTMGEALKDPSRCRGKWMTVSGEIVQIQRSGGIFEGILMTNGLKPVYFVTAGNTDGLLVEDSRATFVGLFAQQYSYENRMGGQTTAVLLVGHFTEQGLDRNE